MGKSQRYPNMSQISSLQAGRAIAALMVAAFHLQVFVLPEKIFHETGASLHPVASMGYAGVEFFFALSGFIMAYVHAADWGRPEAVRDYMYKRIARIYPFYWAVVIPLIIVGAFVSSVGPSPSPNIWVIFQNLILTPRSEQPILAVAWTLQYEIAFYLLFALTILFGRIGFIFICLWGAACIINLGVGISEYPAGFILSSYNLIFLMGMVAAFLFRRINSIIAALFSLFGLAVFFATGLLEVYGYIVYNDAWRAVCYGIGAALIISGVAALEKDGVLSCSRWLVEIGNASYALYLIHLPAFAVAAIIIDELNIAQLLSPFIVAAILLIGVTIISIVIHHLIEKPLVRSAKQLFQMGGDSARRKQSPV